MADLMRHEEGSLKPRSDILVKDKIVGGDEGRATAVEDRRPCRRRLNVDPSPLGLSDGKVIR
jgi:hypothetical protein